MEGISGIVKPEQTNATKPQFEEGRKLYTEEINAAVRGAKAGGATEIVVMDCHGAGEGYSWNSLIQEDLDPDCEFVVQEEWTGYTDFLESGCDAALFVGMHAMAGTADGVLNHTVSGVDWQNLWFNGTLVGETGINAALCGTWGCPVLLVTGDRAAAREAKALLGDGLTTVEVKQGLGARTARLLPPKRARQLPDGHVLARPDACDRGAGVQRPRFGEHAVGLGLVGQVGAGEGNAAKLVRERLGPIAPAVIVDDHLGAFRGERPGAGRADSAGGAGDEHAFSPQPGLHP